MPVTYRALIVYVKLDVDFNIGLGVFFCVLYFIILMVFLLNRTCLCP